MKVTADKTRKVVLATNATTLPIPSAPQTGAARNMLAAFSSGRGPAEAEVLFRLGDVGATATLSDVRLYLQIDGVVYDAGQLNRGENIVVTDVIGVVCPVANIGVAEDIRVSAASITGGGNITVDVVPVERGS